MKYCSGSMESERIPVHVEQSDSEQDLSIPLTEGTVKSWFLTYQYNSSFEVFTVMAMWSSIFWDVRKSNNILEEHITLLAAHNMLASCFTYSLTLKIGIYFFLRNIGWLLLDYMELYPRRKNLCISMMLNIWRLYIIHATSNLTHWDFCYEIHTFEVTSVNSIRVMKFSVLC